ncbi:MAG TPA: trypsin-like peptidase domain-containing protein [Pseudonocardiaceae bacterium]|jgi:S1-C subfamily serine protease|nr:trypsin-like peptidase domain-containing protein [Pseudonocardiaceae bacterium]
MSEFDPRWSGRQDSPGQPGQPGEPSHQGQPGATPADPNQPDYTGYYGRAGTFHPPGTPQAGIGQPGVGQSGSPQPGEPSFQGGPGLGGPTAGGWAGYPYATPPGGAGRPGEFGHTAQFGQPGWQQQWAQPHYATTYQPQRRSRPLRTVGLALGAVGLSVLVGLGIGRIAWSNNNSSDNTAASGGNQNFGSVPGSTTGPSNSSINPSAIAAKVNPGLVDINTVLGYQSAEAAGTGIVLTSNGEILTNNHVVEGATSIRVTDIGNGKTYNATVVGFSRTQDIAVLQLQGASGLTTETLADSTKVSVGDAVIGIGNAGGAGGTPSAAAGRVTALNQSITASDDSSGASEKLTGLIQVDANIQSGDSGGALVNSAGQVIGVDTAASAGYQFNGGLGQNGDATGGHQGYAIPINQAISIAHQMIAGTASSTVHIGKSAFLGVTVSDANAAQQGQSGAGQSGTASGATIVRVLPNGPAESAGLQQGDVVTALNGQTVDSATALTNLMDTHHPGDHLTVTYTDTSGQSHTATVTPAEGPVG